MKKILLTTILAMSALTASADMISIGLFEKVEPPDVPLGEPNLPPAHHVRSFSDGNGAIGDLIPAQSGAYHDLMIPFIDGSLNGIKTITVCNASAPGSGLSVTSALKNLGNGEYYHFEMVQPQACVTHVFPAVLHFTHHIRNRTKCLNYGNTDAVCRYQILLTY